MLRQVSAPAELESTETIDLGGKMVLPGLIDSHMHIESSLITPRRFAEAVLPWGTTSILSDPHEVGQCCRSGRCALDDSRLAALAIAYFELDS